MIKQLQKKGLAEQGKKNLALAERNMKALMALRNQYKKTKPFKGQRIGMALHITKETGVLVRTFMDAGAKVSIASCNPLSTQDDVAAALIKDGADVWGYKGESKKDYYKYLKKVLDFKPTITIDDGCDLVTEIHLNRRGLLKNIIGGCEETTTGIIRLKAMEKEGKLEYPVIAVNDNDTKHLMDNYYGTGQSTIDGILRASNMLIAGKTVVVAGYGSCGKGFALRSKGMGAKVIVTEVDPFRALQAKMDGFDVMPMEKAAPFGDLFLTVTGNCEVIRMEHFRRMKDGAIVANSGHFDIEVDVTGLTKMSKKKVAVRPFFDEFVISANKSIFVIAEGRLANLAAAEGHPSEVMSMSFCGQFLAVDFLVKNASKLSAGVHFLPSSVDEKISKLQLQAMGVKIDKLTDKQKNYLGSWQEGT
ncbi:adenosylhomocysteinase [Candidatus Peregrinibacteria bacterium]|nr:adenosylhomocysteinase [Candidatus Peregrinibacteria bacterium]